MKKIIVIALLLLVGCAQVGLQPPRNFSDQLAYSYAAVTSVRLSAANALNAGSIKVEDAQRVQALSNQARLFLDSAKAAHDAGDEAGGNDALARASIILNELQKVAK